MRKTGGIRFCFELRTLFLFVARSHVSHLLSLSLLARGRLGHRSQRRHSTGRSSRTVSSSSRSVRRHHLIGCVMFTSTTPHLLCPLSPLFPIVCFAGGYNQHTAIHCISSCGAIMSFPHFTLVSHTCICVCMIYTPHHLTHTHVYMCMYILNRHLEYHSGAVHEKAERPARRSPADGHRHRRAPWRHAHCCREWMRICVCICVCVCDMMRICVYICV